MYSFEKCGQDINTLSSIQKNYLNEFQATTKRVGTTLGGRKKMRYITYDVNSTLQRNKESNEIRYSNKKKVLLSFSIKIL